MSPVLIQEIESYNCFCLMSPVLIQEIESYWLFLCSLLLQAQIELRAAYGSNKDINIYRDLGLQPHQIFIVGKASKKQHAQAQVGCPHVHVWLVTRLLQTERSRSKLLIFWLNSFDSFSLYEYTISNVLNLAHAQNSDIFV